MNSQSLSQLSWLAPNPHVVKWTIEQQHIDHYQHTNNVAYVSQLERLAWDHSNQLGLNIEDYRELDRGMAISRHEIDYLGASHLGDELFCATWIVHCDSRLKLSRRFQFIRARDNATLLTAKTDFVCIALSTGKPKRMPQLFSKTYSEACLEHDFVT